MNPSLSLSVGGSADFDVRPVWWAVWSSEWTLAHTKLGAFASVYISYDLHDHFDFSI